MRGSCGALTLVRTGEPQALDDSYGSLYEYLTRPHANGVFTTRAPPPVMRVFLDTVSPSVTHEQSPWC
jgi:hypothetical protein